MNTEELKAAAERVATASAESPIPWEHKLYERINGQPPKSKFDLDCYWLATRCAIPLLSPGPESIDALQVYLDAHTEPVTAEWLRDVWGAEIPEGSRTSFIEHGRSPTVHWCDGDLFICGMFVGTGTTQGQFTMLVLPLGLQPKGSK